MVNGYTLFWAEQMAKRSRRPDETAEQCRQRTMTEANARWKGDAALRRQYSARAKAENSANRALERMGADIVLAAPGREAGELIASEAVAKPKLLNQLQPFQGRGSFGVGDKSWGLSKDVVAKTEEGMKGFVREFSRSWKSRQGKLMSAGTDVQFQPSARKSCQEHLGFCCREITDPASYRRIVEHLQKFVAMHRRKHLVNGKNRGPNAKIQHPLLVLCRTACCEMSRACGNWHF